MKPLLIGIAGGSGAGKSTLCTALMHLYPETIGMVQLDDYFRPAADVPKLAGMDNWDHPDALFLDRLGEDLERLSQGESVMIRTKNFRPYSGGEIGIRTLEGLATLLDFESSAFDHSAISPWATL